MSSFQVRHATRADADAAVEIVRAIDERFIGSTDYTRSDLDDEWRRFDLDRDVFVITEKGSVVAFGSADTRADPRADGYVHPDHFGRGIGSLLVETLEDDLRARGATAVRSATLLRDERGQALLRAHGYDEVRRFWNMRIELTEEPPAPQVPIETLDPAEAEAFHSAYEDAFADHWGHVRRSFESWRHDHMGGPSYAPELWRVIRDDGVIVAGLIGKWERDGAADVSRIFTVREHRRKGYGEALLMDAFGIFWRAGKRTIGLGVDASSNTGAQRLYERVGMHVHWGAVVFQKQLDA